MVAPESDPRSRMSCETFFAIVRISVLRRAGSFDVMSCMYSSYSAGHDSAKWVDMYIVPTSHVHSSQFPQIYLKFETWGDRSFIEVGSSSGAGAAAGTIGSGATPANLFSTSLFSSSFDLSAGHVSYAATEDEHPISMHTRTAQA